MAGPPDPLKIQAWSRRSEWTRHRREVLLNCTRAVLPPYSSAANGNCLQPVIFFLSWTTRTTWTKRVKSAVFAVHASRLNRTTWTAHSGFVGKHAALGRPLDGVTVAAFEP